MNDYPEVAWLKNKGYAEGHLEIKCLHFGVLSAQYALSHNSKILSASELNKMLTDSSQYSSKYASLDAAQSVKLFTEFLYDQELNRLKREGDHGN